MAGAAAVHSGDELLKPREVCEEYPIFGSTQTLAEMRWRRQGPEYIKTAPSKAGRIYYRRSAIEAWLTSCTVRTGGSAAA